MWFSPGAFLKTYMPTGLFPRSLLIIVMPVVVTQIVVAFVFMERHWSTVTQRLSRAVVSDISMLVDLRMREHGGDGVRAPRHVPRLGGVPRVAQLCLRHRVRRRAAREARRPRP